MTPMLKALQALALAIPLSITGAPVRAQEAFSAACTVEGGRLNFVVSGHNAQAGISKPNGVLKYADESTAQEVYITSDSRHPNMLVVIAHRQISPTGMVPRSTYVIDTERGSYTQVFESRSQQDNSTFVVVQSGACSVARNRR
ncbi:hypothetical protein IVB34_34485 [Bradyrhizobium sp. 2]|uniref:hypothetical protein n=1 Tax=unclassified Bradyrhizobium TaxID=2631580 RepID=UPI001FFA63AD|nr:MULTISPECIES: hypothetical protein [unclassified Bradyrhizobium]MCK1447761.1 hypothetical protein [Bradyrhizobium sp. 48]MCK1463330.1 hypothetical protein [Bradyrhizobium sp. 2]